MDFKSSQTMKNLMKAFAGESAARNRYTFAAGEAKKQKQPLLAHLFEFTANQEKEHAELFYERLSEMTGENIGFDASLPVNVSSDLAELLQYAQHNENEEHDVVYKEFSEVAKEEGYPEISALFANIAKIEKTHAERFGRFYQMLKEGKLHSSDSTENWVCTNCGYVVSSSSAPAKCPVCSHDIGYFIRDNFKPYC